LLSSISSERVNIKKDASVTPLYLCLSVSANKYVVPNSRVGSNTYGYGGLTGGGFRSGSYGYSEFGGRSRSSGGFGQGLGGGLLLGYGLGEQ
jgi:hypothetical protein